MSEIKSTLELVMEKTRNLSLSEEEKQQQKEADFKKHLNGLIQHYIEGSLTLERFRDKAEELKNQYGIPDNRIIIQDILSRLQLDSHNAHNEHFLYLLKDYGLNVSGMEKVIYDFTSATRQQIAARQHEASKILAHKHKITGSAIVLNLLADPPLKRELQALAVEYGRQLEQEKRRYY